MKIQVKTPTKEERTGYYDDYLEIIVDGIRLFEAHDTDSPEDANLGREFNDCYQIPELMRRAYHAGKNGEEFIIEK